MTVVNVETGEVVEPLTAVERSALAREEAAIERGADQVATALSVIRDQRLYREAYPTFEAYCRERWGMTRQHANRQIVAAEVAAALEPIGSIPESQARELAPLRDDPDRMREVWEQANDATNGQPTAAAIREARSPQSRQGAVTPRATPRRALADQFFDAAFDLGKAVDRIARLADDDRFPQNAEKVAAKHRDDLIRARDVLDDVLARMP